MHENLLHALYGNRRLTAKPRTAFPLSPFPPPYPFAANPHRRHGKKDTTLHQSDTILKARCAANFPTLAKLGGVVVVWAKDAELIGSSGEAEDLH